jgi:hypothetical protein
MKAFDGAKPWRNMEVERFSFEGATGPRVAKKGFLNMDNDFTVEEPIIGCGPEVEGEGYFHVGNQPWISPRSF